MSKAKKRSRSLQNLSESEDLLKNIIKHLPSKKGVIFGTNAVLRSIEKGSLDAVLLFSRRVPSLLHQALSLRCKGSGVLLFRLESNISLGLSIQTICCGVNFKDLFGEEELSKLEDKITIVKSSLNAQKICNIPRTESFDFSLEGENSVTSSVIETCNADIKLESVNFHHSKHNTKKDNLTGKAETFISLNEYTSPEAEFLDYKSAQDQIQFNIR